MSEPTEKEMLRLERLELCSCVDDEYVDDIILVLKECTNAEFYITDICKRTELPYKYILSILCWLDHIKFIEHGGSIRGSWITDKGEKFLKEIVDE